MLHIGRLHIAGAVSLVQRLHDARTVQTRVIGPLDVTLENFRTDPDNKNPYSFAGTTDAGERIRGAAFFTSTRCAREGELTLDNLTLNKYAPLYQDFVHFEIRDGVDRR